MTGRQDMQATALNGLSLPIERLAGIAALSGKPVHRFCDARTGRPVDVISVNDFGQAFIVGPDLDQSHLEEVFRQGFTACIEAGDLDDAGLVAAIGQAATCALFASVTTASAYRLPLAHCLSQAIQSRFALSENRCDDIELALQEALSNAVIHGNLSLRSLGNTTLNALEMFSANLEDHLANPAFACRRIEIRVSLETADLIIDVVDQGAGFVYKPKPSATASGRGINLIAALAKKMELLDHGRRIRMMFSA
jgi:hypothetical protein